MYDSPSLEDILHALHTSWSGDTSTWGDELPVNNPARGQCVVSSLVIQDYFGGNLVRVRAEGPNIDEKHYFNQLPDGTVIDATRGQYQNLPVTLTSAPIDLKAKGYDSIRDKCLDDEDTRRRYYTLRDRVDQSLSGKMINPIEATIEFAKQANAVLVDFKYGENEGEIHHALEALDLPQRYHPILHRLIGEIEHIGYTIDDSYWGDDEKKENWAKLQVLARDTANNTLPATIWSLAATFSYYDEAGRSGYSLEVQRKNGNISYKCANKELLEKIKIVTASIPDDFTDQWFLAELEYLIPDCVEQPWRFDTAEVSEQIIDLNAYQVH